MRSIVMIICCFLYCLSAKGQNIDSILASKATDSSKAAALREHAFTISERNSDSALLLAKKAIQYSIQSKSKESYTHCLNVIGWIYFKSGKNDSGKWYISKARNDFHAQHNVK